MSRHEPTFRPHLSRSRVALAALIIATLALTGSAFAMAEGPARLSLSPSSATVREGQTVDIAIRLDNAFNVAGAEMAIRFNPAVLEVEDADPSLDGIQIAAPGPFWGGRQTFQAQNSVDNAAGLIHYSVTIVKSSSEPGVDGPGTLATIRFHAKGNGLSALTFEPGSVKLSDSNVNRIAVEASGGRIIVGYQLFLPLGMRLH